MNQKRLYNGGITSDIKLPGIANISWFGHVSDRWDVMADAQWTHWSTIQNLTFARTDGTGALAQTPLNFKDAWRFSLGANYHYDDQWKFRMGVAYDQSPVQDADRTPRLPDSDRTWLAGGVQYAWIQGPEVRLRRELHLGEERLDQQRRIRSRDRPAQRRRVRAHQRHVQQQRRDRVRPGDVELLTA